MSPVVFHKDVYLPDHLAIAIRTLPPVRLRYGPHARDAAFHDRFGAVRLADLPTELVFAAWELVEAELVDGRINKVVVRRRMEDGRWLVLVIHPDGFVRTLWTNLRHDTHRTLRRERYVPAPAIDKTPNPVR